MLRLAFARGRATRLRPFMIGAAVVLVGAAAVAYVQWSQKNTEGFGGRQIAAGENLIHTGIWNYLPGASQENDGLHLGYRDFRIVEQDGSGGQANPPVNEYGTHLAVHADFSITTILKDIRGTVSQRLYARPPEVSDEFRVEPPSIGVSLDGRTLTVERWDGQTTGNLEHQEPVARQTAPYTPAPTMQLTVEDSAGKLTFSLNGHRVLTMTDGHTFSTGTVWFGLSADTPDAHATVSSITAAGQGSGTVAAVDTSRMPAVASQPSGLQNLAHKRRPGFLIGSDVALWALVSDPSYRSQLSGGNFGSWTPENSLKWQFVEPQPGVFDFHEADAIVAEARKYHIAIHGHNLVFGEALPQWLSSMPTDTPDQKAAVRQALIRHVTALADHYKGTIHAWDINEVFADYADDGSLPRVFNDNVFYRAMGPDYVAVVARTLRSVDPSDSVWLNDYGLENDSGARLQAVLHHIDAWQAQGVPLSGLGLEAHIYDPSTDLIVDKNGQAAALTKLLDQLQSRGLKARISEMDAPQSQDDYSRSSQAAQFAGVLSACLRATNCTAFSTWSTGPTDIYQDSSHRLQPEGHDSLFNPDMQPTAAYSASLNVLKSTR